MRALRVVALLMASVVAACGGDGKAADTGPTVPPEPEVARSTTSTTSVSYEVPDTIDQAYVQRVVSAYDKVLGDAIRVLVRDRAVSEEFLKHLLAIYTEPEFEVQQSVWVEEVASGRIEKTPAVPGDPRTSVLALATSNVDCAIARIERDYRATLKEGVDEANPPNDEYVVLVRRPAGRDPLGANPTPWVMAFDGSKKNNAVPDQSCGD